MTQINPAGSNPVTDRNSPSINTTLNRLGRALNIRGASGENPASPGDNVQISQAAASAASTTSIADLRVLLADLETLVSQAAEGNAGADVRAGAQRSIDEAVAVISGVAQSAAQARGIVGAGDPGPANVVQIAEGVENVALHQNKLAYRNRFDVEITIEEPAERAGLLLSFGSPWIDAGTGSSFVLEIAGVEGRRTLSFASGTSITDISFAINTFADVTGVRTTISGTAIRLEGTGYGKDEFISLKIIDDGEVQGLIYGLNSLPDGAPAADLSHSLASFNSGAAANGILDRGKDFVVDSPALFLQTNGVTISGQAALDIVDFSFRVESDSFGALPPGAQLGTPFRFFTIVGGAQTGADGPIDGVPLGGSSPASQALSPFTSSGENAGDFVAALDAIRSLRDHFGGGGVTDDFLADLRRDLIAQAGASLGVTTKSESQQALDLLGGTTT